MYKQCQVVMLPTNQEAPIQLGVNFHYNIPGHFRGTYFHLYILSDDAILTDDYIYQTNAERVIKNGFEGLVCNYSKKIIASTNPSLNLPSPSKEFLKIYCEKQPEEVLVRYHDENEEFVEGWLKVNANNEISIKKVKQTYTRDEIIRLIQKAYNYGEGNFTIKKFIQEHL